MRRRGPTTSKLSEGIAGLTVQPYFTQYIFLTVFFGTAAIMYMTFFSASSIFFKRQCIYEFKNGLTKIRYWYTTKDFVTLITTPSSVYTIYLYRPHVLVQIKLVTNNHHHHHHYSCYSFLSVLTQFFVVFLIKGCLHIIYTS